MGLRKSAKFFFATLWERLQDVPHEPNSSKSSTDVMPNAEDGTVAMFSPVQQSPMISPFYQGSNGSYPGLTSYPAFTPNQASMLQQMMPISVNMYQNNPDLMRRMLLNRYQSMARANSGAMQQSPVTPRPPVGGDNAKSGSA